MRVHVEVRVLVGVSAGVRFARAEVRVEATAAVEIEATFEAKAGVRLEAKSKARLRRGEQR
jgi:hypothetical protein